MTFKILRFSAFAFTVFAFVACQKEPSTSSLNRDFTVYTDYDESADFATFDAFYLPDSILVISEQQEKEYWKDGDAMQIINTVAENLIAAGYDRATLKEDANVGLQLSYIRQTTYFVGYDRPYWWWDYPYYWSPGYWGSWWDGWHYPYNVYYGYTSGSMLTEMVNLDVEPTDSDKLPVVWSSFIGGLLTSDDEVNLQRIMDAVEQSFTQSPYIIK